jgi:hypothetical protein
LGCASGNIKLFRPFQSQWALAAVTFYYNTLQINFWPGRLKFKKRNLGVAHYPSTP